MHNDNIRNYNIAIINNIDSFNTYLSDWYLIIITYLCYNVLVI